MQGEIQAQPEAETVDRLAESVADPMSWMPDWIQPAWTLVSDYPMIGAAVIILLGWLAARLVLLAFRHASHQVTRRTSTDLDDQIVGQLGRPIFATIFYAGLGLATVSLQLPGFFTSLILRVLASLVVFIWLTSGFAVMRLLLDTLGAIHDRFELIEARTIPLFDMISKILLVGLASYALLMIWQIDATAWLASAGVVGIAVGFAAKDSLANLFSGVFIVVDTPYKLGDFINLSSGERGMVTHIGLRSTRLLTRDDIEITIPNAVIANSKIINETGGRWAKRRVRVKLGVAYGSDLDKVSEVLMKIGTGHPDTCSDPAPRVRMRAFGESSIDFELLCWINEPVLRGRITHELLMSVYKGLNEAEIEIPYAKRDLYIKEMPGNQGITS
jgi:small-conductance mechanosensitive channel